MKIIMVIIIVIIVKTNIVIVVFTISLFVTDQMFDIIYNIYLCVCSARRLMVTRGLKPTPFQSPYITIGHPTIVIVPEFKVPSADVNSVGMRLFTVHVRRCPPDTQDPMLNTHSKHNCIQGCIQVRDHYTNHHHYHVFSKHQ